MATVFYRGFYREIEDLCLWCALSGEVTGKNSNVMIVLDGHASMHLVMTGHNA